MRLDTLVTIALGFVFLAQVEGHSHRHRSHKRASPDAKDRRDTTDPQLERRINWNDYVTTIYRTLTTTALRTVTTTSIKTANPVTLTVTKAANTITVTKTAAAIVSTVTVGASSSIRVTSTAVGDSRSTSASSSSASASSSISASSSSSSTASASPSVAADLPPLADGVKAILAGAPAGSYTAGQAASLYPALNGLQTSCKKKNAIAYTFDDGPSVQFSNASQYFIDNDVKSTFFVNGNNWGCIYDEENVAALKAAFAAGHQIASHTWSHPDMAKLTEKQLYLQIDLLEVALYKILGVVPAFIRPPYGSVSPLAIKVANARGLTILSWDYDSGDTWGSPSDTVAAQVARYQTLIAPLSYVTLQHDVHPTSVFDVLPAVLPGLMDQGYDITTAADCLGVGSLSQMYKIIGTPQTRDKTWTCDGTPEPGSS